MVIWAFSPYNAQAAESKIGLVQSYGPVSYKPIEAPVVATTAPVVVEAPVVVPPPVPVVAKTPVKAKAVAKKKTASVARTAAVAKPVLKQTGGQYACSCYMYAVNTTGRTYIKGYGVAARIPVNSQTPAIGSIVITWGGAAGHAAVVTDIRDGMLVLSEANYSRCKVTHGRLLPMNSRNIKGYVI